MAEIYLFINFADKLKATFYESPVSADVLHMKPDQNNRYYYLY